MINFVPAIAKVNKADRLEAILNVLKENDVPYLVQPIPASVTIGQMPYAVSGALGNVIVTFNRHSPEPKTVISAHYDNFAGTPGANDNAAACSILLNLILDAKKNGTDKHLEFVFFDLAETEPGQVGSYYYLHAIKDDPIRLVCNLDMCGNGSNVVVWPANGARDMIAADWADVHEVGLLPESDANAFINEEIPTVCVISSTDRDLAWFDAFSQLQFTSVDTTDFWQTMHKPGDTPDTCNTSIMERIYRFTCGCLGLK